MIFNPVAARDRARNRLAELESALGSTAEFWPTQFSGHAEELAKKAAESGEFAFVAAAGGDGTVHEVANGLLLARKPEVAFRVFPLGSANDYAYSLRTSFPPLDSVPEPQTRALDVGVVRAETGRERYFVNTLGLGFSGAVALESRRIRRFQGLMLYGLAFLRALWSRYECPLMTCTFDEESREERTLSLTVALGQREGSFVVAPAARLDDGLFDILHVGPLSRWEVLRFMPRLAQGGRLPADYPSIWLGRCQHIQLRSEAPLTVHLDGEFFSRPEDGVRALDIRILPGALRVEV